MARYTAGRNAFLANSPNIRSGAYFLTVKKDTDLILAMPVVNASRLGGASAASAKLTIFHPDGTPFVEATFVNPR